MISADLPPMYDAPTMQCVRYAANEFKVPQLALMAVLQVEGGKPGMKKRNPGVVKAYEYDYGRSQFNKSNLQVLRNYGIQNVEYHVQHNDCYNIRVGAWWLKREMVNCGDLWCGIGNYHTGSNIKGASTKARERQARNRRYQKLVYQASLHITQNYRWQ